jgi:hypothetical protein
MRSLLSFTLLSSLLSILLLLPHSETVLAKQNIDERSFSDITKQILVEAYQFAEYPRALKGLFANIGPDGSKAPGVPAGVVLASPSTGMYKTQALDTWLLIISIPQRIQITFIHGVRVYLSSFSSE